MREYRRICNLGVVRFILKTTTGDQEALDTIEENFLQRVDAKKDPRFRNKHNRARGGADIANAAWANEKFRAGGSERALKSWDTRRGTLAPALFDLLVEKSPPPLALFDFDG